MPILFFLFKFRSYNDSLLSNKWMLLASHHFHDAQISRGNLCHRKNCEFCYKWFVFLFTLLPSTVKLSYSVSDGKEEERRGGEREERRGEEGASLQSTEKQYWHSLCEVYLGCSQIYNDTCHPWGWVQPCELLDQLNVNKYKGCHFQGVTLELGSIFHIPFSCLTMESMHWAYVHFCCKNSLRFGDFCYCS